VRITFVSVAVNIGLNLILVKYMQNAGLALATSAAQATATILLYIAARRQYPQMKLAISWLKVLKILVFTALSVGVSYVLFGFLSGKAVPGIICLAAAAGSAAVIYLILLRISGFEELGLIRDLFARNRTTEENR
jgi:putative peptidoglycan lipid II flippase